MAAPSLISKSTCPYCGVGCGVLIEHDGVTVKNVRGDPDHPANFGRLCSKGSTLHLTTRPELRVLSPQYRMDRSQPYSSLSWQTALEIASDRFAEIIKRDGPDAVAFYISGQLTTEDYYVFNKLAKGLIGTNNVDTNSRLCMSSAVAAYKQTLGADAPPCCYDDFDDTDCYLIAGSNMAYAHPIAFRRIEAAKAKKPEQKIIVVDPRRTATAEMADLHLAIKPGTDIWLYNAMLYVLCWENLIDQDFIEAHTEGFDALRNALRDVTPKVASAICGVRENDIIEAARLWGRAKNALSLWCQGLNQSHHGTHNGAALIALSLATGKIGRPGSGPFSLTGQPNAMGGREVGGMANLLSGHRDLANAQHRQEVADLWGIESVPDKPGLTAVELFKALKDGQIKAVWIACTNPAQSMPNLAEVKAGLEACEFVVLQEAFDSTETARFAHMLLPPTTWAEKDGTVTNSERRITRVAPAIAAPGETRHDWQIVTDFALALGRALGQSSKAEALFPYTRAEEIYLEHAKSTTGRDLDISGLNYQRLETEGPMQWPVPSMTSRGTARLYSDFKFATPSGRARFIVPVTTLTAEKTQSHYPFALLTGRLRDQWHGMSRTGRVAQLHQHVDEPRVELCPDDMFRRGLETGDFVQVKTRRGEVTLKALASPEIKSGEAFISMHWGRSRLNSDGVNALTQGEFDPYSKQPELKFSAAHIKKVLLPYEIICLVTDPNGQESAGTMISLQNDLAAVLNTFDYAASYLAGRDKTALVLHIRHREPVQSELLEKLDQSLGLDHPGCLRLSDPRRGIDKKALFDGQHLIAVRLSGETKAQSWLKTLITSDQPATELRPWLLAPFTDPPGSSRQRGQIICSCMDVDLQSIQEGVRQGKTLEDLQATLKCGTQCGSCLPEVRRIMNAKTEAVL